MSTLTHIIVTPELSLNEYWPAVVRVHGTYQGQKLTPEDAEHLGAQLIGAAHVAKGRLTHCDAQPVLDAARNAIGVQVAQESTRRVLANNTLRVR